MSAFDAHLDNYGDPGPIVEPDAYLEMQYEDQQSQVEAWQIEQDDALYEEQAAYQAQREFEIWADERHTDDPEADVSEAAYLTYLEGFFHED